MKSFAYLGFFILFCSLFVIAKQGTVTPINLKAEEKDTNKIDVFMSEIKVLKNQIGEIENQAEVYRKYFETGQQSYNKTISTFSFILAVLSAFFIFTNIFYAIQAYKSKKDVEEAIRYEKESIDRFKEVLMLTVDNVKKDLVIAKTELENKMAEISSEVHMWVQKYTEEGNLQMKRLYFDLDRKISNEIQDSKQEIYKRVIRGIKISGASNGKTKRDK